MPFRSNCCSYSFCDDISNNVEHIHSSFCDETYHALPFQTLDNEELITLFSDRPPIKIDALELPFPMLNQNKNDSDMFSEVIPPIPCQYYTNDEFVSKFESSNNSNFSILHINARSCPIQMII